MRQLRVVGLGDDHETVILEDPIRHERFAVSGDERLRAAARGDVRRLGQMEIEVTSPMRPRDIQARVRAGESVEDVAAAGGVSIAHVERFAYPVLLERARVAEIARRAHPVLPTDPTRTDGRTLGEIVAATFSTRGQDLDDARWDARKGEDAQWVVTLAWQTGRSDNTARWTFRPGTSGGTVDPRDDPARELLGQEPVAGPRRVDAPGAPTAAPGPEHAAPEIDDTPALAVSGDTAPARRAPGGSGHGSGHGAAHASAHGPGHAGSGPSATRRAERGAARRGGRPPRGGTAGAPNGTPGTPGTAGAPGTTAPGTPAVSDDQVPAPRAGRREGEQPSAPTGPPAPTDAPVPTDPPVPAAAEPAAPTATPTVTDAPAPEGEGSRRTRRHHPIVPSWEDVLLGTRSPRS